MRTGWLLPTSATPVPAAITRQVMPGRLATGSNPGQKASNMAEPVILINAFEVPAAEAGQFIAAWEKTRDYLETQPGYIDTALHQAFTPDAEFQFVNVAHWETAERFLAATQSPGFRDAAIGLVSYTPHPSLYRVVRT
jgi:heme-degrading monooxygenase HmoA